MNAFVLRSSIASSLPSSDSSVFQPPTPEQLLGQWFIIHTSLPFWRDKRNIKITYSVPSTHPLPTNSVDDTVTYQALNSESLKTVQGINIPTQSEQQGTWDWRGSGWVKVVSNHWEILGHGLSEDDGGQWILIHTQKSFFSPAAVHLYSRSQEALPEETRKALAIALAQYRDLNALVEKLYQVRHD